MTSTANGDTNDLSLGDTIVSHDDTLAREREELFNRLDELNKEPLDSVPQKVASPVHKGRQISPTVAHLIQSAKSGT